MSSITQKPESQTTQNTKGRYNTHALVVLVTSLAVVAYLFLQAMHCSSRGAFVWWNAPLAVAMAGLAVAFLAVSYIIDNTSQVDDKQANKPGSDNG